ncbi:peptide MFS transporter [Aurantiacibacter marinus]|uniref:Amino acid transporter n=1 Tax=Aurantiacibacter marinus TaxID=874156 RepID=A0A0H0XMC7_9SPHN|nr:peptide MFS transporter [Aurantiacibacter marinus]KLI63171.1 hypothetical protein AAV99_10820 [Aurantiacibacter marinus]
MSSSTAKADTGWLGHPKGLLFLSFTELWERFSFYGMRALLILYLVQDLLISDRVDTVLGMDGFRNVMESMFGPMSTQAFASQLFGLYAGFVYFTPLFGGLIADRWLGPRKTVMIGILLMTAGHFAMIFDVTFLIALLLLVLGSGCLKGNIAAQVGELYPKADEALRSRGYTLFSTGINIGAVIGPLVCGLLAQIYGWHTGFAAAGVVMVASAAVYFAGMRHYADEPTKATRSEAAAVTSKEWRMIALVAVVISLTMFQWVAWDQLFNVGLLWVADHADLSSPFGNVPVAWFASIDSLASILIVPFLVGLWRWQAKRGTEPTDLGKMSIAAAITALSCTVLAVGAMQIEAGGKVSIIIPVLSFSLSGIAFMWAWPQVLAIVSRRSPDSARGMMMAAAYLTAFASAIGAGYIARFYEPMGAVQFWWLNAGISMFGAVIILVCSTPLRRAMDQIEASQDVGIEDFASAKPV